MTLPALKLDHLLKLTDDAGILQFATLGIGDPHSGYAIDDNARALVACARLPRSRGRERLASVYLRLMERVQRLDGTLAHQLEQDGSPSPAGASDDGLGRCVWACAEVMASDLPEPMKRAAASILHRAWPHLSGIRHVRGWANAVQGLALYADHAQDERGGSAAVDCADQLLAQLSRHSDHAWTWFEDILTYEPGRMPLGLLYAAGLTGETRYLEGAVRALAFLERTLYEVTPRAHLFNPIGNGGWYPRGGERACYDQQPVDAGSLVEAYTAAAAMTGERKYRALARDTFAWFLGANAAGAPVYDRATGACRDGLHPLGVSRNAGAESTICYLLARLALSAKTAPISRLRAVRDPVLGIRGVRPAGNGPAAPGSIAPRARPTASQHPATPSPRQ